MLINRMNKMILLGATLSAVFSASVFAQATVEQVMSEGEKRADAGAAEQRRVEQIADQTADLLNDYNTVSKVVDGLVTYNALLQRQIDNQNQEMAALNESIRNVSLIERQILPMMTRMLDSLEVFIELDTPFLLKERQERLGRLRGMMERSDVSAAEKFRRVVEAYQIENDYGRTIEAYKDTVEIDGVAQEADFLRIGRVSLAYQTVGGGTTGAWDKDAGQFVKLDDSEFKNQVAHGLKVARKQVAPDLLVVPVPAASEE
jgi:flagellar motility protein MotE (MotC chaperone)